VHFFQPTIELCPPFKVIPPPFGMKVLEKFSAFRKAKLVDLLFEFIQAHAFIVPSKR